MPRQARVKPLTRKQIQCFFSQLQQQNPAPRTELFFNTHFQLLAAVLLSAQTTDKAVNKCTPALFAAAPDAKSMAALGADGIVPYIRTIGLFNAKAHNLAATAHIIAQQYQGTIPDDRQALEALPGVGRKTANVVLNQAFGHPTMAVDTHVFRVANRTGLGAGKTPLAVEQALVQRVPAAFAHHAHHWLILLGRYTCLARTPQCDACLVADYCHYPHKTCSAKKNSPKKL